MTINWVNIVIVFGRADRREADGGGKDHRETISPLKPTRPANHDAINQHPDPRLSVNGSGGGIYRVYKARHIIFQSKKIAVSVGKLGG